jgi:hypothetical protein
MMEEEPTEGQTEDEQESDQQESGQPSSQPSSSATVILTRLISVAGHVAFRQMVHLDTFVFGELKRRRAIQEQKKDIKTPRSDRRGSRMVRQFRQCMLTLLYPSSEREGGILFYPSVSICIKFLLQFSQQLLITDI